MTAKSIDRNSIKKKSKKNLKGKIKKKPKELNLKGWLKTPHDWAEFDAWAKIRAQPKKRIIIPPVVRCKRPLRCIINHLRCLARPKRNFGKNQCMDREIPCSALNYVASDRMIRLAWPRCRETGQECREWGVNPDALCYVATQCIIDLSQPRKRGNPQDCKLSDKPASGLRMRTSFPYTEKLAKPKQYNTKSMCCEKKIKCGKPRELSAWMEFLALPSYKHLKDQDTENAVKLKSRILDETEVRGKQAFEAQMIERGVMKPNDAEEAQNAKDEKNKKNKSGKKDKKDKKDDKKAKNEKNAKKKKGKKNAEPEPEPEGESEADKMKRRVKKDPWRFTDSKCGQFPPPISSAAKKCNASELTKKLAQPLQRESVECVKECKKNETPKPADAFPRLEGLAKPKFVSEPVKKIPPRECDKWGKPIIPVPKYERILPKPKEYQSAKCKDNYDEENRLNEERERKIQEEKTRAIDVVADGPTIDPLFDPLGAQKQAYERKRAAMQKKVRKPV